MPVKQFNPVRSSDHETLVRDLAAEWSRPAGAGEPVILEESDQKNRLVHVYVVWSRWSSVDRVERSEIIMDAAAMKLPQDQVLNITVAMGLTPEEADDSGLPWR